MARKITGFFVLIAVIASLVAIICINSKYIFRSEPYYSQTELNIKCDEAYNKAIDDNRDERLFETIDEYMNENSNLKEQINNLESDVEKLTQSKEDLEIKLVSANKNIASLTAEVDAKSAELSTALAEKEVLENELAEKSSAIETLTATKNNLESELETAKANLQTANSEKATLQSELDSVNSELESTTNEKEELEARKLALENELAEKSSAIETLTATKNNLESELETTKADLQTANSEKETLQSSLNSANQQIESLKSAKTTLQQQLADAKNQINTLTKEKEDLQKEINEKNELLAGFDTRIVTFDIDGTETLQNVVYGSSPIFPDVPIKEGYVFAGWQKDGTMLFDTSEEKITANTKYVAVFKQKNTAEKCDFGKILTTSSEIAINQSNIWIYKGHVFYSNTYELNKVTKTFEKITWTGSFKSVYVDGDDVYVDGVYATVDLDNHKITYDTNTYNNYMLSSFSKYVWTDGENVYYSGWSQQKKLNRETKKFETVTMTGLTKFYGEYVWKSANGNCYYSNGSDQYKWNKQSLTWEQVTWVGVTKPDVNYIWTANGNTYHTSSAYNYKLNEESLTWENVSFSGYYSLTVNGSLIWTDGENVYLGYDCEFDSDQNFFEKTEFHSYINDVSCIWKSANGNCYYSNGSSQYKLNKKTNIFEKTVWNVSDLYGSNIRICGDKTLIITSNYCYVLNDDETYFEYIHIASDLTSLSASYFWNVGDDVYYSNGSSQYKLNCEKLRLEPITWEGLTTPASYCIWNNAEGNTYHTDSNSNTTYKLIPGTTTWQLMTIESDSEIVFRPNVWTDGTNNYYYDSGTFNKAYKLNISGTTIIAEEISDVCGLQIKYASKIFKNGNQIYYFADGDVYRLYL